MNLGSGKTNAFSEAALRADILRLVREGHSKPGFKEDAIKGMLSQGWALEDVEKWLREIYEVAGVEY